jgi:hypothetical protein
VNRCDHPGEISWRRFDSPAIRAAAKGERSILSRRCERTTFCSHALFISPRPVLGGPLLPVRGLVSRGRHPALPCKRLSRISTAPHVASRTPKISRIRRGQGYDSLSQRRCCRLRAACYAPCACGFSNFGLGPFRHFSYPPQQLPNSFDRPPVFQLAFCRSGFCL